MEILNSFFILHDLELLTAVKGEYQYLLVLFSYIISVIAAYTAIYVLRQVNPKDQKSISKGRLVGAAVMGIGIWSMHFTGMLAYQMKMVHNYHLGLTVFSMLTALVFSYAVFYNITLNKLSYTRILLNAPIMGFGISLMHYVGMAAMEMDGEIKYIKNIFILSILIAIGASAAAMWIMYYIVRLNKYKQLLHIIASIVMGVAICGMHYTGMAATIFIPSADCRFDINQSHIGLAVTIIILFLSIIVTTILLVTKSITKDVVIFSKYSFIIVTLYIVLICSVVLLYVNSKNEHEYADAVEKYRNNLQNESEHVKEIIEHKFDEIYSNIHIISRLPSIRTIERHAKNLTISDNITIQEIYNNLVKHIKVSEVYILPGDFNPDAIDPETGELEAPILSFDNQIIGRTADKNLQDKNTASNSSIEEVEIYEYRLMVEQISRLNKNYPTIDSIDKINVPAISGKEVLTCDNSQYSPSTPNESDRFGIVYSLPFYDMQGRFKGMVSAIFLTNMLQKLFPNGNYILLNSKYNQKITAEKPSESILSSGEWIAQEAVNPNLLYSEVFPLSIIDDDSKWKLWVGVPNEIFINGIGDNILRRHKFEYIMIILMGAGAIVAFFLLRRNYLQGKLEEERRIRENEKHLNMIANSMPCLLWVTNASGVRTFFNKTWYDFTGRKEKKNSGEGWVETIHSDDIYICLAKYDKALKEQKFFEMWYRLKRYDGEYRWMLVVGMPRFGENGVFEGFIVTCTDITEQRKVFEVVKNERRFAQSIMDAIPDPIFVKDKEHMWRAGNKSFWKMMGGEAKNFVGKNDHNVFSAEQAALFWGQDDEIIETGKIKTTEEYIKQSDGTVITALITKSPLAMPDGMHGLVGVIHDITERKKNEEELRMHRDNLQELVDEQTKDIIIQKDRIEKSAQVKSEFLSNMSHELRTPMHAILNYANMGLKNLSNLESDKLEKYFNNIQVAGNRLLGLLNNLLDLTKIDSGKMNFLFAREDFREVVEHVLLEIDSLLNEKNINIEVNIITSSTEADFDKFRMVQVMVNLLSNAIKFSSNHSTIQIILSDACLPDGRDSLCCMVVDEGSGIPDNELEIIFEKFMQSSKTKTGAGGTGLGLAICKEIIESHGGKIWAENGNGKGAVFSFLFPKE